MADDEKRVRDDGDEAPDAPLDAGRPEADEQVEAGRAGRGADGGTAARADQERRGGP